jgi:3-hydroxy-9,10-secoandrosta-1,3,5(10)-triene-9,17-dione monooxygenase reductase component
VPDTARHCSVDLLTATVSGHPSGVAVVTTSSATRVLGFAATAVMSYSADPPLILLSVSRTSRTHDYLVAASEFGLHMLAQDQNDIAALFASKSDAKFDSVPWEWDHGVPRIHGVRAFLRCAPAMRMSYADHTVVIASVLDISVDHDADPLLHYRRAFTWSIQPF